MPVSVYLRSELRYTICGEWFPEVFPAERSERWTRGDEDSLETEMRLFCACTRWAYNRVAEGWSKSDILREGRRLFGLNSRYLSAAFTKAETLHKALKAVLEYRIAEAEEGLRRAARRLARARRDLALAEERGDHEKAELLRRVEALEEGLAELRGYQERGEAPSPVFGGRRLWRRVCKGRASREEWRAARRDRLSSYGDSKYRGNLNFRIEWRGGGFVMAVAISHLAEQAGTDHLGRPNMRPAPRAITKTPPFWGRRLRTRAAGSEEGSAARGVSFERKKTSAGSL